MIAELCLAIPADRADLPISGVGRLLGAAMATLDLLLVDWPRAQVVEPAAIDDYLTGLGG